LTVASTDLLEDLISYPSDRYANIDLDRLTAFGVRLLIQRGLRTTFENIVATLFRSFPDKFGLVGYPQYPDAARVNRALLHCLPKYRNYLSGGAGEGYRLTAPGEGAAAETEEILLSSGPVPAGKRQRAGTPRSVADHFMKDVQASEAFLLYRTGRQDEVTAYNLARLLHGGSGTSKEVLMRRLQELENYAAQTSRLELGEFLEWARSRLNKDQP
jgi:hypothetical protein